MKPKKTAPYSDQTADQRVIPPIPWNNKRATTRSNDLNAIQWILHCEQCDIWNIRQCDSSSKALQSWATHNPFPKSVLRNCSSFLPMTFQEYELYQRKQLLRITLKLSSVSEAYSHPPNAIISYSELFGSRS